MYIFLGSYFGVVLNMYIMYNLIMEHYLKLRGSHKLRKINI